MVIILSTDEEVPGENATGVDLQESGRRGENPKIWAEGVNLKFEKCIIRPNLKNNQIFHGIRIQETHEK